MVTDTAEQVDLTPWSPVARRQAPNKRSGGAGPESEGFVCKQRAGVFLPKGNRTMLKDFQPWSHEGQVAGSGSDPMRNQSRGEGSSGTEERRQP